MQSVSFQYGKGAVVRLSAGRNCITLVKTNNGKEIFHNKSPCFDIENGAIENGGVISVEVIDGEKSNPPPILNVTNMRRPDSLEEYFLTESDHALVSSYISKLDRTDKKQWHIKNPFGVEFALRLNEDGSAELKEYSLAWPSYEKGVWSVSGNEILASFYQNNRIYRVSVSEGKLLGVAVSKYKHEKEWKSVEEKWLVMGRSHPFFSFNEFDSRRSYYVAVCPGIEYPKSAFESGITGDAEVEFELVKNKGSELYEPIRVKLIGPSSLNEYLDSIFADFSKYKFIMSSENEGDNIRHKTRISLIRHDDRMIAVTELDPDVIYNEAKNLLRRNHER